MTPTTSPAEPQNTQEVIKLLTQLSVGTILTKVCLFLEAAPPGSSTRRLLRENGNIIIRQDTVIDNAAYVSIVDQALSTELDRIFETFFPLNRDMAVILAMKVSGAVHDRPANEMHEYAVTKYDFYTKNKLAQITT